MKSIDLLEHGGGNFAVRHLGMIWNAPDPREMHYQRVLITLNLEFVDLGIVGLSEWKNRAIFERWCAAWDLPSFNDARRLAYIVDHYRSALSHDLATYAGEDLGRLWRERRWIKLLDLIDHLPAHSHYSATVANDEDHARMVAEAIQARRASGEPVEDRGPSLVGWTPEVAAITRLIDATNAVRHAVIAVQVGKKAGAPPEPERRPKSALEKALKRAEFNRRKAAHEALVARVLPHKAAVK